MLIDLSHLIWQQAQIVELKGEHKAKLALLSEQHARSLVEVATKAADAHKRELNRALAEQAETLREEFEREQQLAEGQSSAGASAGSGAYANGSTSSTNNHEVEAGEMDASVLAAELEAVRGQLRAKDQELKDYRAKIAKLVEL